ncbi:histidine phosphatase family protein [Alicyclobacillus tolerans]|uniref:Broad specificity phosphatase PhoE n=2 Tax=Alicyclobacillus tolerans TaxID=90970 RepID=A0ABT9LWV4_9BACL|nr:MULTISPECIES: histidine phosphatase family protein [Alicyclobacillus]MDP9728754.1 broad specificity phosphatase PhoE [Alicyclobacillus tengchongensis]QRF23235.1 histidine phosphatase family protein [Alicyclobacillus sp. TC]SHK38984.1 broad-specificity phosphatase PhoE [Alicyclobacillus montanus]
MEIWLIRHGETDWNIHQRVQGWADIPLNENGLKQAEKLADYLKSISPKAIYSSDLQRAKRTAEILAEPHGLPVQVDERLRERCKGSAEGIPFDEIPNRFPQGVPDEETDQQLQERLFQAIDAIAKQFPDESIIWFVTHGGAIRMVLESLGAKDLPYILNTSISRISGSNGNWNILNMNTTAEYVLNEEFPNP